MNDKIMRCPLCLSLQIETSNISVATGIGVVEKQEVRCLGCQACHIAETTEEAINGWNAYASKNEYPAELTGHPLLQRWAECRSYDNYCEKAADGEYVRYGDHCFKLRSVQAEVEELGSMLGAEQAKSKSMERLAESRKEELNSLQSELTKARELIRDLCAFVAYPDANLMDDVKVFLSNQSAPADKG